MFDGVKAIENSDVWLTRWSEYNRERLREFTMHAMKLNCDDADAEKAAGFKAAVIGTALEPVVVALVTASGGDREGLKKLMLQAQLGLVKGAVMMFESIKSDQDEDGSRAVRGKDQ
jgi:DNA transposition AAA+ family ATPase